jgi:uncharacterized protein (TIGR03663 family)
MSSGFIGSPPQTGDANGAPPGSQAGSSGFPVTHIIGGHRQLSDIDPRTWWVLVSWVLIVATMIRLYDLDLKPLHHDEGVNGFFLMNLLRSSAYRYDPGNYHGPTLYYFAWASTKVFGVTTVAIRLVPALFGLVTVCLVLSLRRRIGSVGALVAATLLSISSGAVYFSRYFIHETLLVCFTVGLVVAIERFWDKGRLSALVLGATSGGLMFATKETALISAGVLAVAAVTVPVLLRLRWSQGRPELGSAANSPRVWRTPWLQLKWRGRDGWRPYLLALTALCIFVAIQVIFYSSLFTHLQGVTDALKSVRLWADTGTQSHIRGWSTYLFWLSQAELPLLILGGLGASVAIWRRDNWFVVFVALWAVGTFVAYSLVPYKTPWLTLNIIVPLTIIGGYAVEVVQGSLGRAQQRVLVPVAAALLTVALYQAVNLSFFHYDDNRYPYVYAHTQRDVLELVAEIGRISKRPVTKGAFTITVTSPDHFPLSWYLRYYQAGFYGRVVRTDDPIIIGAEQQETELAATLGERYQRINSYTLRPGVTLVLYVRRDLSL